MSKRIFAIVEADNGLSPHVFATAKACDEFTSGLEEPFGTVTNEAEAKEYYTAKQMNELSNKVAKEYKLKASSPKDKPASAKRFLKMLNLLADNADGAAPAKATGKGKKAAPKATKKDAKGTASVKKYGPRDKRFTPLDTGDKLNRATNADLPKGLIEDKFSYNIVVHPDAKATSPMRKDTLGADAFKIVCRYDGKTVGDFCNKSRDKLAELGKVPMSELRYHVGRGYVTFKKV